MKKESGLLQLDEEIAFVQGHRSKQLRCRAPEWPLTVRPQTVAFATLSLVAGLVVSWCTVHRAKVDASITHVDNRTVFQTQIPIATRKTRLQSSAPAAPALTGDSKLFLSTAAPGYLAADVVSSGLRSAAELFSEESRDPVWASQREDSLSKLPEREFQLADPKMTLEVECRHTMCRVRVTSDSPFLTSQFGGFPFSCGGALVMGELELQNESGKRYADLYVMFHNDALDEKVFALHVADWCASGRESFLGSLQKPFSYE